MPTSLTVPKILNYPPSMNYALLRQEGLRHIERLGSAIWTDFNSHDPGVTMMEVLCYALTDLGYRTQLPETDLFTPSNNRKAFFTAAEILPNAPITALDFRKILIDTEGVKNAWLEGCGKEQVLYQIENIGREFILKLDASKYPQNLGLSSLNVVLFLKGVSLSLINPYSATTKITTIEAYFNTLYRLKKDKKSKQLKGLTNGFLESFTKYVEDKLTDNGKKVWLLQYAQSDLSEITNWLKKGTISENRVVLIDEFKKLPDLIKKGDLASTQFVLEKLLNISKTDKAIGHYLFIRPIWQELICKSSLMAKAIGTTAPYTLFNPKGIHSVYLQLEQGYEAQADKVRQAALKRLHENRALSEDFDPDIKVVENVPIGITTNIELTPEADMVQVYADILYAIENFLAPTVQMYGLQEMMEKYATFELTNLSFENLVEADLPAEVLKNLEILRNEIPQQAGLRGVSFIGKMAWTKAVGKAIGTAAMEDYEGLIYRHTSKIYESHQVFQGPLLKHGFIDDAELEAAHWRRVVYKSDLFQILSKIENVIRVQKLDIKKCPPDDENPTTVEKEWCLSFDCDCQPTLELDCSKFNFNKDGRPIPVTEAMHYEVLMRLEQLRGQTAKIDRTGIMDLPIPQGIQRDDLAEYTSIQEEFPRTYHVGREGIVSTETPLRKAQVKQMKGFLMFFDQILTNYLARLAQVRDVLAVENTDQKLPLYQTLYDVPNIPPIFNNFNINGGDWEAFKADENNGYIKALMGLTDGSPVAQKLRQNQLLDHLLARFGEQFTDYVLDIFKIERPLEKEAANTEGVVDWVEDKRRFLKNLPTLGSLRGRGFDYQAEPEDDFAHFWESNNVEGFKRRVMAQLGIQDWSRRTISCTPQFIVDIKLEMINRTKRYRFGMKSDENSATFWLLSQDLLGQKNAAEQASNAFFTLAADTKKYAVITTTDKLSYVGFWSVDTTKTLDNAMLLSLPMSKAEADTLLKEIQQHIEQQCQSENFHVVEHILLRPTDEHYKPLLKPMVCSDDLSRLDPYSFWITIIMPDWVERYSDDAQYRYFEQLVRSEVPAHIAMRFVKLNREKLIQFEETYFNWLKVKTDKEAEAFDLREATNTLAAFLNTNP
jgi:hypothetical protein